MRWAHKDLFLKFIFEHLAFNGTLKTQKDETNHNQNKINEPMGLSIKNGNGQIFDGNYKKVTIRSSRGIVFKNAKIDEIEVYDTSAKIIDSQISGVKINDNYFHGREFIGN